MDNAWLGIDNGWGAGKPAKKRWKTIKERSQEGGMKVTLEAETPSSMATVVASWRGVRYLHTSVHANDW